MATITEGYFRSMLRDRGVDLADPSVPSDRTVAVSVGWLRDVERAMKEDELDRGMAISDASENAAQRALSGTMEVYSSDGYSSADLVLPDDDGGIPVCRAEFWHDHGDPSVGIGASEGWRLCDDQSGTALAALVKKNDELRELLRAAKAALSEPHDSSRVLRLKIEIERVML